ncbi:MAG: ComF family protein [Clostridia bacterium]|nr:ComF family protein [Clostridia bacterium]
MILNDLFFPDKCPFCDALTDKKQTDIAYCNACPECEKKVKFFQNGGNGAISGLECAPSCDKIFCLFSYTGRAKKSLQKYKFGGETWIGKIFYRSMYEMLRENGVFEDCLYITYVPITEERFAERGFDQSKLIAEGLSKLSGRMTLPLIVRNFQGQRSSEANAAERALSNEGKYSFEAKYKEYAKGKNILLIDDILTTGSTLEESASCLKAAGCGKIYAATVATGRRDV